MSLTCLQFFFLKKEANKKKIEIKSFWREGRRKRGKNFLIKILQKLIKKKKKSLQTFPRFFGWTCFNEFPGENPFLQSQ